MKIKEKKLTNLQLELLQLFNYGLTEQQLKDIKYLLTKYFAKNATDEMDKIWKERGFTKKTIDDWLNKHLRTPYK